MPRKCRTRSSARRQRRDDVAATRNLRPRWQADRRRVGRVTLTTLFVALLGYLVLGPLIRLQTRALENHGQGYSQAFSESRFGKIVEDTVALAVGSLVIGLVLGTLLAWAASRLPRRLRFLGIVPVLPIVVPAIASVVGWAFLLAPAPGYLNAALRHLPWLSGHTLGPFNVYTLPWIVILTGIGLTSFVYLFVRSAFANISSDHLEAAQISGSSSLGVFFRVILPLLRPSLVYGGGVALLLGLGQFTAPLLLGGNQGITVLTTDLYSKVNATPVNYGAAAAIGSPLLLFGLLIVIAQRFILGDQRRFVTHGGKGFRPATQSSWLGTLGLLVYGVVALVLPLAALVVVSVSRFWSSRIVPSKFTLDNFRNVFSDPGITAAVTNSLTYSIIAIAIVLPLGFLAATILLRGRNLRFLSGALDLIVTLPLGVPAVLFGVGFLLTYSTDPLVLYGTEWVMILVYVTLMLPFSTRMQLSAFLSLGDGYQEAARTSGAGVLRTNLTVVLPLVRSALGGAAALMFVLLSHEFTASVLVRSVHTQVMGTALFDYWSDGSYPLVAAIALVMTAVTALGVGVAMLVGGSDVFGRL